MFFNTAVSSCPETQDCFSVKVCWIIFWKQTRLTPFPTMLGDMWLLGDLFLTMVRGEGKGKGEEWFQSLICPHFQRLFGHTPCDCFPTNSLFATVLKLVVSNYLFIIKCCTVCTVCCVSYQTFYYNKTKPGLNQSIFVLSAYRIVSLLLCNDIIIMIQKQKTIKIKKSL